MKLNQNSLSILFPEEDRARKKPPNRTHIRETLSHTLSTKKMTRRMTEEEEEKNYV